MNDEKSNLLRAEQSRAEQSRAEQSRAEQSRLNTENSEQKSVSPQRDTGIELLRIVAMILIIAYHFSVHGGWTFDGLSFNSVLVNVLAMGGNLGVNIFVVITGFYSVYSGFSTKRIARLLFQVTTYSVVLYAVSVVCSAQPISLSNVICALFPLLGNKYWFFVTYFLLQCLVPFLNAAIKNITQKQHATVVLLLWIVWSVLPTTIGHIVPFSTNSYSDLGLFIMFYLFGAYLRKYPFKLMNKKKCSIALMTTVSITFIVSRIIVAIFESFEELSLFEKLIYFGGRFLGSIWKASFLPPILAGLFFISFKQLNPKPNKLLYAVASATFGVYLIHDNDMMRRYLWDRIIQTNVHQNIASTKFALYAALSIVIVFIVCTIIEIVRKTLLDPPFNRAMDRLLLKSKR